MAELIICEPLRPAKTGYRRSWTEADVRINNVIDDNTEFDSDNPAHQPVQPLSSIVKQKVSDIEYNVWNKDYKRSWTEADLRVNRIIKPTDTVDPINPSPQPTQPDILMGWNGDYERWKTESDLEINPPKTPPVPNPETGLSQQFVQQTLYKGFYVLEDTMYPAGSQLPDEKKLWKEYKSLDVCGDELSFKPRGDSPVIFVESATLCMEDDRDNIFKTEFSFQAIQLEDNTSLSHFDYTDDYLTREEDNIALSLEQGGLIEPYGI